MVLGEGAGAIVIEDLQHATARGARIYGEVVAAASRAAASRPLAALREQALANVLRALLKEGDLAPDALGHLHAHGLSTRACDVDEARAIGQVFGHRARPLPVTAAKSYFGNLGAGGAMVELIASLLAFQHGPLFRILNYETPDPDCPVAAITDNSTPSGDSFINLSVTPQAQASGLLVRRFQ
jgi:3-oxoacyl-[acyl-carrier-protein] synthase II